MKKIVFIVFAAIGILFYSNLCQASLIELDEVVYDDSNNQYWVRDLSLFVDQNLSTQLSGISGLNGFYGLTNWHLASLDEMTQLWNYSIDDITGAFLPSKYYDLEWTVYSGRYDEAGPENSHYVGMIDFYYGSSNKYSLSNMYLNDSYENVLHGAWVAGTNVNNIPNVPEPATMALLGSFLFGLIGYKKIKS